MVGAPALTSVPPAHSRAPASSGGGAAPGIELQQLTAGEGGGRAALDPFAQARRANRAGHRARIGGARAVARLADVERDTARGIQGRRERAARLVRIRRRQRHADERILAAGDEQRQAALLVQRQLAERRRFIGRIEEQQASERRMHQLAARADRRSQRDRDDRMIELLRRREAVAHVVRIARVDRHQPRSHA